MLMLPTPELFSWKECLWFLDRRYDDCLYSIAGNSLTRAIILEGKPVLLSITGKGENDGREQLHIDVLNRGDVSEDAVMSYVGDWFDLGRDLRPFYALLKAYPRLSYMASDFQGLRLVGIPDLFEALCWCVIGQQINLKFAHTLKRKLVESYGASIEHSGNRHFLFPQPQVIAALDIDALKALQFSRQKADYLLILASAFSSGELSLALLQGLPDLQARLQALTSLRGIGPWTANYVLMKSLREQSCVPYGDVGLLNALLAHGLMNSRSDTEALHAFFAAFSGWESYTTLYLWRSLSPP